MNSNLFPPQSYWKNVGTALVLGLTWFPAARAAQPPLGIDRQVTISEDVPFLFSASDFGFSDAGDAPPNAFNRVKLTTIPQPGVLTVDGVAAVAGALVSVNPVAGLTWTARDEWRAWESLASSADGTRLAAVVSNYGLIYTSADSGLTWVPRETGRDWDHIACSADGSRLIATTRTGPVVASSDAGVTWTILAAPGPFSSIASASDGMKWVAIAPNPGLIHTSADAGATWVPRGTSRRWTLVASSTSGTRLAATVDDGPIYTSTDSGATWSAGPSGSSLEWTGLASSADGQRLVAVARSSRILTSGDGGLTWSAWGTPQDWSSVASSTDGNVLVATALNGRIFVSIDAGVTWEARANPLNWSSVAVSADGRKVVAGVRYGYVHTSTAAVPVLAFTPATNAFGSPYASFTFQVEDDGPAGLNLDPTPNVFGFSVAPVQDVPTVVDPVPDQIAARERLFSYQVSANTFADGDAGSSLTYAATLTDGSPLPSWLSFNAATLIFSGTPSIGELGVITIRLTATDNSIPALSGSDFFTLTVADHLPDGTDRTLTMEEDSTYIFQAGDFGFTDSHDSPPNQFERIKLTTLPSHGVLRRDGVPAQSGDFVSMLPVPGGVWTARELYSVNSLASSADGTKLVAGGTYGELSTSSNAGLTWTQRKSTGKWQGVASSANGIKLVAIENGGRIHTSANSGVSWTARESVRNWQGVASSSDGTKLVATGDFPNLGRIFTSTDSGVTWMPRGSDGYWRAVASSADGTKLVAATFWIGLDDDIYTSIDSGLTWTARGLLQREWLALASSADGLKLYALALNDRIFVSPDGGATWTARGPAQNWFSIALSADGTRAAATTSDGQIHTSLDSGMTWTPVGENRDWIAIASSADGSSLIASTNMNTGRVYTSAATLPVISYSPLPNGNGLPYDGFTFQVEDGGAPPHILDPSPNTLALNVINLNDAPAAALPLPDQTALRGQPFNYQFDAGSFTDSDPNHVFSYTVGQSNGSSLPSWLNFDASSRAFSGVPGNADVALLEIRVTATDNGTPPLSASATFRLTVPGSAPQGMDKSFTIDEDVPYVFTAPDFGFSDPGDVPPNSFSRVGITSLPAAGSLTIDAIAVVAGESVSFSPEARMGWTPRDSNRSWHAITSSADGTKLAAITTGTGPVYISEDSGASWTARANIRSWTCIASSSDGTKLAAGVSGGQIYTSTDSGLSWTARETNRSWYAIASSADGVKLTAADYYGYLYVSADSGTSWTVRATNTGWASVSSSADGTRLAASPSLSTSYQIHTSSDSGLTWQPHGPSLAWLAVVSSADGSRLLARVMGGSLYRSTDSGLTWTATGPSLTWSDIASSSDGLKLVAVASGGEPPLSGGRIHISSDGGITWYPREMRRQWNCIASSADGLKLVAGVYSGKLYTSQAAVPQLTFTPAANAFGASYANLTFQVRDDGSAGPTVDSSPDTFFFNVVSVNDAPRLTSALSDGYATERTAINSTFLNRFTDVENGTILSFSVTRADNSPLPGWLSFNPVTNRFSGTPQSPDTGILNLTLTATDSGTPPLSTGAPFRIIVANIDDNPSGSNRSATLAVNSAYTFSAADFGFSDALDVPANNFTRIKLTTLPGAGVLSVSGSPAVSGSYFITQPLPTGDLWVPRESNRVWYGVASSADGTRLAATVNNGRLYTSTDAGVTWTPRESSRNWYGIASSADGEKLVAVAGAGTPAQIYTSTDAGVTWTARESNRNWRSVTSSSDGTKLAATVTSGPIYTSIDAGITWTPRATSRTWYSIASSSDGSKLAAVASESQIYTSTDSGITWTPRETTRTWRSITSSADGTRLAAVANNGQIYTSSDSGITWTAQETIRNWYAISSSADGLKLAAVVSGGGIYMSADGGTTWVTRASQQSWRAIASSADGSRLAAGTVNGQIFTTAPTASQALTYTPAAGGSGIPYDQFTFQVEDAGGAGANLDPTPNILTVNVVAGTPFTDWATANGLPTNSAASNGINLLRFGFGLSADGSQDGPITVQNDTILQPGWPVLLSPNPPERTGYAVLFGNRKIGATVTVQFSADLASWENSSNPGAVMAGNDLLEARTTPFPSVLGNGRQPRFFRVAVTSP